VNIRSAPGLFVLLVLAGCGDRRYSGTPMQPALVAPDVPIPGAGSSQVSFARSGGRLTLTTFGYTSCPDVCPTTLASWREVRRALGADAAHVRFVFVSGDWRHDTPETAASFARAFDPAFVGVAGDSVTIHRVLPAFQAEVGYGGPPGSKTAGFAHSDFDYVVDETGRIALWYPFTVRPEALARDLRRMLRDRKIVPE
jgi:protein SCO1/2